MKRKSLHFSRSTDGIKPGEAKSLVEARFSGPAKPFEPVKLFAPVEPFQQVKPFEPMSALEEVKPLEEAQPMEEVNPLNEVNPSKEVKLLKDVKLSKEIKSSKEVKPPEGKKSKFKKTKVILAVIVLGGILAGGTAMVTNTENTPIPSTTVKRGPVAIKITEIGELRAQDQITIGAPNDKMILWMAPEGKWVEEGDTLVVFESEKYMIARGEASSGVLVARADLTKTQSDLEGQRTKEEAALQNYNSLAELAKKGFVMESEVGQARLAYLEAQAKTRSLKATVDAARANVQRANRGVAQQDRKLRETFVLAPRAGLVVYAMTGDNENPRKVSVGMIPFEGMNLMHLPDVSTMMVDAEISEVDLARLKLGQLAEIRLDAFPDAVFKGEVNQIADLAQRKISTITGKLTGAKVFRVTIKVLGRDERLKPGLTATVDILVNQHNEATYLPLEAIFVDEQDRTIAYMAKTEKIAPRPLATSGFFNYAWDRVRSLRPQKRIVPVSIVIGESNDRVAVIEDGLQEGQMVYLTRPPEIQK
ncbi:MAG: efflux RND transporter periplasmic adaptor subunit [bacterium]